MDGVARFDRVDREANGIAAITEFMLDDGVHVPGQRRAGGDGNARAGGHVELGGHPRPDGMNDRPRLDTTDLRRTQRVAVHLGPVERWKITIGGDRFVQYPTGGKLEHDALYLVERLDARQRVAQRLEEAAAGLLGGGDEEGAAAALCTAEIIRDACAPLEVGYLRMLLELSCGLTRQQQRQEDEGKLILPG